MMQSLTALYHSSGVEEVVFKFNFNGDVRVQRLSVGSLCGNVDAGCFEYLKVRVQTLFDLSEAKMKYIDADKDEILIASNEELYECFNFFLKESSNKIPTVRLNVYERMPPLNQIDALLEETGNPPESCSSVEDIKLPKAHRGITTPCEEEFRQPLQSCSNSDTLVDCATETQKEMLLDKSTSTAYCSSHKRDKCQAQNNQIHRGIICDGCDEEIQGIRYKCLMCEDFDFCSHCEKNLTHPREHFFIKITHPIPYRISVSVAGYPSLVRSRVDVKLPYENSFCPELNGHVDSQGYVTSDNVSDGTIFSRNAKFTKTWELHNSGRFPWPETTKLVHQDGNLLFEGDGTISVGSVQPGESIAIPINFTAPPLYGRAFSIWMLDTDHQVSYLAACCQITVEDKDKVDGVPVLARTNSLELKNEDSFCKVQDSTGEQSSSSQSLNSLGQEFVLVDEDLDHESGTDAELKSSQTIATQSGLPLPLFDGTSADNTAYGLDHSVMGSVIPDTDSMDNLTKTLNQMGFLDDNKNVLLLKQYDGDIKSVIRELLN
eukprot:Nk52_evm39s914 gene=Nk52_evmTU39s914